MPGISISPRDAGQLELIARVFRETGEKTIRNDLERDLRASTKQTATQVRQDIDSVMPKKGGLNHFIAVQPTVKTDLRSGRESIEFHMRRTGHDFKALDRGLLRHPLFGDTDHWYSQHIPSGWWEQYMTVHGDHVIQAIQESLDRSLDSIGRSMG